MRSLFWAVALFTALSCGGESSSDSGQHTGGSSASGGTHSGGASSGGSSSGGASTGGSSTGGTSSGGSSTGGTSSGGSPSGGTSSGGTSSGGTSTGGMAGAGGEPSDGGANCMAMPAQDSQCGNGKPPHLYKCFNIAPYTPPAGCVLLSIGNVVDTYCCP